MKMYLTRILAQVGNILKLHRSCSHGVSTLRSLVLKSCHNLMESVNSHSYSLETYSCFPSRSTILVRARLHKQIRLFDSSTSDLLTAGSIAWSLLSSLIVYSWLCRSMYLRMTKHRYKGIKTRLKSSTPSPPKTNPDINKDQTLGNLIPNMSR